MQYDRTLVEQMKPYYSTRKKPKKHTQPEPKNIDFVNVGLLLLLIVVIVLFVIT